MKPFYFTMLLAGLLFGASLFPLSVLAETKILKIGVSVPLTGDASTWGTDIKNGILFSKDYFKLENVELIFEDDRCNPKDAASVAQKFTSVDKVDAVLGYACSAALMAAAPIYERSKVPAMSSCASAPAISDAGEYIYRTWASDTLAMQKLHAFLKPRVVHLAIVTEEGEYTRGLEDALIEINESDPGMKITTYNFLPEDTDLRTLFTKIRKDSSVSAIMLNTISDTAFLRVLKQMKQAGLKKQIFSAYWGSSGWFLSHSGKLSEGIISVDSAGNEILTEEGKKAIASFKEQYEKPKFSDVLIATTIESVRAMMEALTQNEKEVREYLNTQTFKGVFGDWRFDKKGDIADFQFSIKRAHKGKIKQLD